MNIFKPLGDPACCQYRTNHSVEAAVARRLGRAYESYRRKSVEEVLGQLSRESVDSPAIAGLLLRYRLITSSQPTSVALQAKHQEAVCKSCQAFGRDHWQQGRAIQLCWASWPVNG